MSGEASFASALRGVGADGHILPTNPQGQGSSSTNPNAAAGSSSQNTAASQAAGTGGAGAGAGAGAGSGAPVKRKRNLPGTPDPEAEVIALSPKTLMATNRFVCEICNKGFQRDQNLQLHRRGHNLPWKLRQRTTKEIKKRVYICPEPNCVHHDPSRALGDLTGIKKHYCRKHGEKKWKCDKCSKRYAVQSDWKAHSKTCGTREYRCDCGTLFSRRDSFITHRAFCDALAEESARVSGGGLGAAAGHMGGSSSFNSNPLALGHAPPNAAMAGHVMVAGPPSSPGRSNLMRLGGAVDDQFGLRQSFSGNTFGGAPRPRLSLWFGQGDQNQQSMNAMDVAAVAGNSVQALYAHSPKPILPGGSSDYDESHKPLSSLMNSGSMYPAIFSQQNQSDSAAYAWAADNRPPAAARSLSLSTSAGLTTSSASGNSNVNDAGNLPVNSSSYNSQSAQMSATALLQKAAQMGATASNSAFRGFTIPVSGNSASVGLGLSWPTTNEQQQQQQHQRAAVVASQNSQFMKPPMEQMLDQGAGSGFHSSHHPQQLGSARSENSGGLHDLMNSLSGNGLMGIMQQSPFMEDSASFTGLNMIQGRGNMNPNAAAAAAAMKEQVAAVAAAGFQRGGGTGAGGSSASSPSLSSSSSLSQHHHHHHHHNMMSSMQVVPGLLTGMGNPARNSDDAGGSAAAAAAAAEGLTRDFLGVGGVHHQAMQARAFQQHNEQITGNYSGIDITASFNRADDLKSWEAAT